MLKLSPDRQEDELVLTIMRRHLHQTRELGPKKSLAFMAIVEAAYVALTGL